MIKFFSAAAAALTLASAALPTMASADPIWRVGQGYVVRYHDLDLNTAQGRQVLLARVERASAQACRGQMLRADERACREQATRAALTGAGAPAHRAMQLAMTERDGAAYASR